MKTMILLIPWIAIAQQIACGQGTLNFSNLASGVDAPVTNAAGIRIVGPGPYVADLFWSSDTNAPSDSLTPASFNQPFLTTTLSGGGYFLGGTKTLPTQQMILAQIRVWDTSYGATYAQARGNGGEFGSSNPILALPTIPPPPAWNLIGLQGFQLGTIPEPSFIALALFGSAALFFCRRWTRRPGSAHIRT
jgi:hypothetical protein